MSAPDRERTRYDLEWFKAHSELGVAALILLTGLLVLVDSLGGGEASTSSDPLGAHTVPLILAVALLVLAVLLARDVLRGGKGEAEAGEDVDLDTPPDKRTVLMLAGVLVATAALIPLLGWPLAGMGLFWGAAYSLGSRTLTRDALIAAGVSLVTWALFDVLLGVDLPGGPLMGVFG